MDPTTRTRQNAISYPCINRSRRNAITSFGPSISVDPIDGLISEPDHRPLEIRFAEMRREGLYRAIGVLSSLSVDWTTIAGKAVNDAVSLTAEYTMHSRIDDAPKTGEIEGNVESEIYDTVTKFLKGIVVSVEARLTKNKYVVRMMQALGLGVHFLKNFLRQLVIDSVNIDAFLPVWSTIKGFLSASNKLHETVIADRSIGKLEAAAENVASGVPSIAMEAFREYAIDETAGMVAGTVWQFGKTLASLLLQILTAGGNVVFDLAAAITERVISMIKMLYQARVFDQACEKCRTFLSQKDYGEDFEKEFLSITASCPLLGAYFFGMASYIGQFNLTSLFARPEGEIVQGGSQSLISALTSISATQRIACRFISQSSFQPIVLNDDPQASYVLKMMKGIAEKNKPIYPPTVVVDKFKRVLPKWT